MACFVKVHEIHAPTPIFIILFTKNRLPTLAWNMNSLQNLPRVLFLFPSSPQVSYPYFKPFFLSDWFDYVVNFEFV